MTWQGPGRGPFLRALLLALFLVLPIRTFGSSGPYIDCSLLEDSFCQVFDLNAMQNEQQEIVPCKYDQTLSVEVAMHTSLEQSLCSIAHWATWSSIGVNHIDHGILVQNAIK